MIKAQKSLAGEDAPNKAEMRAENGNGVFYLSSIAYTTRINNVYDLTKGVC